MNFKKKILIFLLISSSASIVTASPLESIESIKIGEKINVEETNWDKTKDGNKFLYKNKKKDILIGTTKNIVDYKSIKIRKKGLIKNPFFGTKENVEEFFVRITYKDGETTRNLDLSSIVNSKQEADIIYKEALDQIKELSSISSYIELLIIERSNNGKEEATNQIKSIFINNDFNNVESSYVSYISSR